MGADLNAMIVMLSRQLKSSRPAWHRVDLSAIHETIVDGDVERLLNQDQIADLVERPDFLRRLLGDYSGAYSLGVGRDPEDPSRPAIILYLEGARGGTIPDSVKVGEDSLRIITKPGFIPPKPL